MEDVSNLRNVSRRVLVDEGRSPEPESSRPALLKTLNDTGSENPRLGSGSRLFTKVHSEEEESS